MLSTKKNYIKVYKLFYNYFLIINVIYTYNQFSLSFFFLLDIDYVQPLGDLASFQNEWLEVEILHPTGWRPICSPSSLNKSNSSTSNIDSILPEANSLLNTSLSNTESSLPLSNQTSPSLMSGNDSSIQSSSPLNTSFSSSGPKVPPFLRDHLEEICEEAAEDESMYNKLAKAL